ncbi:hypothetical protein BpHYR1_044367 [Brachionus plicatilis]|uniref:Uncharacterized protein n=1 Tax=Brachionus plicatilis TaxID=10195 RepID=A0A3M7SSN8_BRAPC|nr:hypothetical protein BpHYR1_044367 [Brachionus plicatilis]
MLEYFFNFLKQIKTKYGQLFDKRTLKVILVLHVLVVKVLVVKLFKLSNELFNRNSFRHKPVKKNTVRNKSDNQRKLSYPNIKLLENLLFLSVVFLPVFSKIIVKEFQDLIDLLKIIFYFRINRYMTDEP